jgi:hypothetical protein
VRQLVHTQLGVDMTCHNYFSRGESCSELALAASLVMPALHQAGCGMPLVHTRPCNKMADYYYMASCTCDPFWWACSVFPSQPLVLKHGCCVLGKPPFFIWGQKCLWLRCLEISSETIPLSQHSLQLAPIFRLLLKVAVKGMHQCDSTNFCMGLLP